MASKNTNPFHQDKDVPDTPSTNDPNKSDLTDQSASEESNEDSKNGDHKDTSAHKIEDASDHESKNVSSESTHNGQDSSVESSGSNANDALITEKFMQLYNLLDPSQKMEVLAGLDSGGGEDDPDWDSLLDTDFFPGYDPDNNDELSNEEDEDSRRDARSGDPRKREKAKKRKSSSKKQSRKSKALQSDDSYDVDDEEWSTFDEMDDEESVLADNGDSGALKLTDSIVTYEMDRYINPKTDRPYSRIKLRNQPPVLRFRQHRSGTTEDEDESVEIIVTRPLAVQMQSLMSDVIKAYDGVPLEDKKREPFSFKHLKKSIADTWKYEPAKVIIVVLIAIIAIAFGIYGVIQGL